MWSLRRLAHAHSRHGAAFPYGGPFLECRSFNFSVRGIKKSDSKFFSTRSLACKEYKNEVLLSRNEVLPHVRWTFRWCVLSPVFFRTIPLLRFRPRSQPSLDAATSLLLEMKACTHLLQACWSWGRKNDGRARYSQEKVTLLFRLTQNCPFSGLWGRRQQLQVNAEVLMC